MGKKNIGGYWFERDDEKSDQNYRRRKLDFEAAAEAFFDEYGLSGGNMEWRGEQRFQLVGRIPLAGVIAVVYTIRWFEDEDEEIYRIISARLAEKHEQEDYYRRIQKI